MKYLDGFFNARLFSIHPHTLRIQRFNGQGASMLTIIDRKALRHDCEICCIENMTAESPAWVHLALLKNVD
jgi:hypothetical protein